MAGNFAEREENVFKEIEIDEGEEILVGNERTVFEENEVVVLEDSEEENKRRMSFPDFIDVVNPISVLLLFFVS
ncbi:5153_t:CDS:2 [Dentiscutata erythropus]|uniref:5153_t:CDS:1 n=1 Tax=Dentiscutata erythropus TaxID=1348616 RepID=A0A9N9GJQ7_9GLOM|nr:5153_t:CDS:2 [Dentiscutata erythropus]